MVTLFEEPATRGTKDGAIGLELLKELATTISIQSMERFALGYLGISKEVISRMEPAREEQAAQATFDVFCAWSNKTPKYRRCGTTNCVILVYCPNERNAGKEEGPFNEALDCLPVPTTTGNYALRDKGGNKQSRIYHWVERHDLCCSDDFGGSAVANTLWCVCKTDWSRLHLASLKLLQEDDEIKLSFRIDQDTQTQIDLKMILTGVEEGRNQAIFTGRLCDHYDLKILLNLDDFPDEKKEKTFLPLSPADSPKSLRSYCEGLTEPDPRRVAAAYSFVLQKAYKEYTGMKVSGASAMLQLPGSDITIHIPDGVHGVLVAHAHTDFQPFREIVPERECFISPVAEVQYIPRDKNEKPKKFMICIPHNVEDKDAWANIQVRRVDIYRNAPPALVPPTDYKVDENFIKVLTKTFGQFVCSVPGCPEECTGTAQAFLFGNSNSFILYACNPLYNLEAFRRALIAKESATKDKRELLKQSDMKWDPEVMDERQYIKVLFSSPVWNPRLRSDQEWDEKSRTVMEIVPVRNLPLMSRCYGCRLNPTCIAEFDFRLPEGSSFPPFTGELKVVPQGEREKPILEFFL